VFIKIIGVAEVAGAESDFVFLVKADGERVGVAPTS